VSFDDCSKEDSSTLWLMPLHYQLNNHLILPEGLSHQQQASYYEEYYTPSNSSNLKCTEESSNPFGPSPSQAALASASLA